MYAAEQTAARGAPSNTFAEHLPLNTYVVPKTILLIQNDGRDAHFVREALTRPSDGAFQVEWVRLCSEGLKRLAAEVKPGGQAADAIAAVLVDLFLPDSRGIETFDKLSRLAPHIPILVLSASQDEEVAKLAVKRGAQDYLLKARLDGYLLPKTLLSMVERAANAEALFEEKERAQVTLNSIGDAVISTDVGGRVTYLNAAAESMTGWSCEDAAGRPLEEVFRIVDAATRETAHESHDAGDSGKQNRRSHLELRPDPARWHRSRHRRLRRTHPRPPGTRDRRRHGVS